MTVVRSARARALTAALAALLVLAMAAPAAAADRVAYRTALGEVVIRDVDGDGRRALQLRADQLAWSPDGTTLAYTDEQGIWLLDADDADATPRLLVADPDVVTRGSTGSPLDFSPDGSRLAYSSTGIAVVPLAGGDPVAVTTPPAGAVDLTPRWSPDGSAVAYRRMAASGWIGLEVVELPADPGGDPTERVLVDSAAHHTHSAPSWAPDGTYMVVEGLSRLPSVGPRQLYRVDRQSGAIEALVTGERWQPAGPAVSPDGRHVAYARVCAADDCTQQESEGSADGGVWLLDTITGGSAQLATTDGFERDLGWTADGSSVVFESRFDDSGCHCDISDLFVATVGAGGPRMLETFQQGPLAPVVSPGVVQRLSGPSRIETAVTVSRATFDAADVVVLARADAYPDALAGAALAGMEDGPLLLSQQTTLPRSVRAEILRLRASRVVLLGDETALSSDVEQQLQAMVDAGDLEGVERIGGATRYDTAALVADRLAADHAYVVQGASADPARGWPDAVAAAGVAASQARPLLLVEQDRLPAETARAITEGDLQSVTIVGGTAAVSEDVARQIRDLGVAVERLAGPTRYDTSVAVAQHAADLGADADVQWFATGRNWPDTLAAGPAAAHTGGVLLLVDGQDPAGSPASTSHLTANPPVRGWIAGGPDVVVPAVRVAVERHAAGGSADG